MNQTENFNQVQKIFKLQTELNQLQNQQVNLTQQEEQYWQLDIKIKALTIILKNLTSLCFYCQQTGANFDCENGKLAHYECYQKWWELLKKNLNKRHERLSQCIIKRVNASLWETKINI